MSSIEDGTRYDQTRKKKKTHITFNYGKNNGRLGRNENCTCVCRSVGL